MSSVRSKALYRDLEAIFDGVSTSSLGDGPLLDRFLTGRGAVKERAFEALVGRHGPMVFQVCRRRLGDRHEAEDACQAVFLVLARRAGSVRNRESLDGWLYGVAIRVANRARKDAERRRLRERRAAEDVAVEGLDPTPEVHGPSEAVHQALARLPEKYRSPIVLCHLEGLTHDQAAARLGCPVGTVRSRLARGRDRLRRMLTRRGAITPSALGWLSIDAAVAPPPAVPASLAADIVRTSCLLTGSSFVASSLPSVPISLMQGALTAMRFEKLALLSAATAPAAAIALAAGFALAQGSKHDGAAAPAAAQVPSAPPAQASPEVLQKAENRRLLLLELVKAAQDRFEISQRLFARGQLASEQVADASVQLAEAELLAADGDPAKTAEAGRRQIEALKALEELAKSRKEAARGTEADVLAIRQRRLMAELALDPVPSPREAALEKRVEALESRLDEVVKRLEGRSR